MKNIHLLPTEKSSRLYLEYGDGDLILANNLLPQTSRSNNQNVHITSDEKIKSGDWCINLNSPYQHKELCRIDNQIELERYAQKTGNACRKIILTTDQSLDGVQAIDDEFLNWFIKNPSCESVEVEREKSIGYAGDRQRTFYGKYKIIIPKEEPEQDLPIVNGSYGCTIQTKKQETLEEFPQETPRQELNSLVESWQKRQKEYEFLAEKHRDSEHTYKKHTYRAQATRDCWKELLTFNKATEGYYDDFKMIEGENIEEAAKRLWKQSHPNPIEMAIFGAEWQQEQDLNMVQSYLSANLQNIELLEKSYSEQEVKDLIEDWTKMASGLNMNFPRKKFNNWSEQFIKK